MTRIVLCHEWLTTYGGSDQVASRLAQVLDAEKVLTYAAKPGMVGELFGEVPVETVARNRKMTTEHWQWFLPHMPFAWRGVDLSRFDVVVTSAHSCVNAVRPRDNALLMSYCHTPMRYAWDWRQEADRVPAAARALWPAVAWLLRKADRRWAQRVDLFLANSRFVAARIADYYGRASLVVHPPVDMSYWTPVDDEERGPYFLASGRLVAYKRPDLVVEAAAKAGCELVVAGDGPMLSRLRRMAGPSVTFVVSPGKEQLRDLYRGARAYVFGGIEDFGMSVVEAQACGTPVIAYNAGGVRETVLPGISGELVQEATTDAFARAMRAFAPDAYSRGTIRAHAEAFDIAQFDSLVLWALERAVQRDWQSLSEHPRWVRGGGGAAWGKT